jgi:nitrite reductase (NADH) large subunit
MKCKQIGAKMTPQRLLIIGSGIAGLSAAKAARKQDARIDITILGQEDAPPFYRLRLCELIGKDLSFESLWIHPLSWYTENRVSLLLSHRVLSISEKTKVVSTDNGDFPYDTLIVTSGSMSFMPPFSGRDLNGIHTLWNFSDITAINEGLKTARNAVVIGGGLLGLETAYCICKMNITTTLVEGLPRLLPKQLDEEGSAIFTKKVKSQGIHVVTGQSVKEFQGDSHVKKVVLSDGQVIPADIVIVSVGVRPNIGVISGSGILADRYILVNERMLVGLVSDNITAKPDTMEFSDHIYAAGDVASCNKTWFGQWSVSMLQGQTAGMNAAGGQAAFQMETSPYVLGTMGTKVVVAGSANGLQEENPDVIQKTDPATYSYIKLVFQNNILTGGILIGDYASKFVHLQSLIKNQTPKDQVSLAEFDAG